MTTQQKTSKTATKQQQQAKTKRKTKNKHIGKLNTTGVTLNMLI